MDKTLIQQAAQIRGPDGLWSRYDPQVLDLSYFQRYPANSWRVIKEIFYDFFGKARPNPAHQALAQLEAAEVLHGMITQNIDNLHQEAGSRNVIEVNLRPSNYTNTITDILLSW